MNFTRLIRRVARRAPDSDAVVADVGAISFAEFWESISSAGQFYIDSGVAEGDRVLLVLPNSPEFLFFHFGALKNGAISVPVRYDYTGWEVGRIASNCQPRLVISTAEWLAKNQKQLRLGQSTESLSIEAIIRRMRPGSDVAAPVSSHSIASINYSYFGDGYAKGAMLTHGNHLYAATGYARHQGFRSDDRLILILPMCHVYALSGCVNAGLVRGAALVLSNNHMPRGIFHDVERHGVTILSSVPAVFECLASYGRKDRHNLSSLRRLVTGGAYMPAALQSRIEKALGTEMVQGYGLTECLPIICNPPGAGNRRGTLGVPGRRDIKIRIVAPGGQTAPCGASGEIQIRSTTTMAGYFRLPDDTRKLFDGDWLRTGDLGRLDEDGYLHFDGMSKTVLNVHGNKVDPIELREVIAAHPAVEAVTIWCRENCIYARVSLKLGETATQSEIRAFCAEYLAPYKLPQVITIENYMPAEGADAVPRMDAAQEEAASA